jgi:hypothetical protein
MKSHAEKLLEQLAQNGSVSEKTFWGFDGDLLDGKATWNEILDGKEYAVRLLTSAVDDLEVNYSWPRSHFMRGIYLIISSRDFSTFQTFKDVKPRKESRTYIYVPCLRVGTEKIQTSYNELFLKAKTEGLRGLSYPGPNWEYSRLLV